MELGLCCFHHCASSRASYSLYLVIIPREIQGNNEASGYRIITLGGGVWHVLFDRFSLIPYLEDFDSNV